MPKFSIAAKGPTPAPKQIPQGLTPEMAKMLDKIASVAGGAWHVDQVGYEGDLNWVKFHIIGLLDSHVVMKLETNRYRLFEMWEIAEWQIVGSQTQGPGLWLHHLHTPQLQREFRHGIWFH